MLKSMMKTAIAAAVLAVALHGPLATANPQMPAPQGRVILQMKGHVERTNAGDRVELDLAMLEAIGVSKLQTTTAWTDGQPTFEGVLLRDLLKHVGAAGKTVTAVAINDYKVEIPAADFDKYPVILAYKMNGELLKVRDKGPLWIVYPQDEFPELKNKATQTKWVWQVKELRVN
ncbi:MAG TPA: molybdopterin-dependent oxidoreductase [Microvirga sp.]|nr:molybdopterin-dependent oxidoreductase [Microvirga sp.]